jgi:glycosyltransferase involved in cell wall biosynthesis
MMRIPASGEICFACRDGQFMQCTRNKCIHNSKVKSLLATIEARLYDRKKTYAKVDVIICPSEFMKKMLDTNPILAGKTIMLHNFMDRTQPEEIEKEQRDYVVYFGRYAEEKGTKTLLQACRALPEIPFVFAGTGPLEEAVGQVGNVENRGFLTGDALRELIAGARFSVYPSEWYENCPFSVMESQMYGTPVLVSDLGGAPELVQAGRTGEIFRGGDVHELTKHIRKLWERPELCRSYSENCRDINFDTVEAYCDKMIKIYLRPTDCGL